MIRLLLAALVALAPVAAVAQTGTQDRRPSHCVAIADAAPGLDYIRTAGGAERLWRAATQPSHEAPLPDYTVRLHFVAHASFLIRTPGGLTAVTDYTGFIGNTELIPDVVT
ncbi:MAG: hypothetical protein ACLFTP_11085, partial [Rhodosalinus sp.]